MTQDYIANLLGTWASELNTGSVLLRITLSVVLSAIIGCERSSKRHSAGLRTFIIISLASATAAITEMYLLNMGYASPRITAAIIIHCLLYCQQSSCRIRQHLNHSLKLSLHPR